ncbi:MAG: radical SAM protein [Victivallaceae bacterium]|nr:radical SAM protein [Victivallaceae bacterium]
MFLQLSNHTFVRHFDNMSEIVNQRNDAKFFLQDAEPFLRFISCKPQTDKAIVAKIAKFYDCTQEEIAPDFADFIQSLQGAVLTGDTPEELTAQEPEFRYYTEAEAEVEMTRSSPAKADKKEENDDFSLINDFLIARKQITSLHIDLTDTCTERCVHCYVPEYGTNTLSFDVICKVIDEYRAMGGLEVEFSGGEPMCHPQFCEILRYARKCDLMITVLSNLTLLNEEIVKTLADVRIKYLQTSVYSMIPEIHDAITRRPGSFKETVRGIELMRKYNVPMKINTPVLKKNFDSWHMVEEFCADQNYKFSSNATLLAKVNHDCGNLDHGLNAAQMRDYLSNCQSSNPWGPGKFDKQLDDPMCEICTIKLRLDASGNYYPCTAGRGLILGNCYHDTMQEAWHSELAEKLRDLKQRDFPECFKCTNRCFCMACPAANFNETGDLYKHRPVYCMEPKIKYQLCKGKSSC